MPRIAVPDQAHPAMSVEEVTLEWVENAALALEIFAVTLIMSLVIAATVRYGVDRLRSQSRHGLYAEYRRRLGRSLLLGLEILVAADIVRTVALEPSVTNVAVLGILVLIRTFLSWSLQVEVDGRWPWNRFSTEQRSPPEAD